MKYVRCEMTTRLPRGNTEQAHDSGGGEMFQTGLQHFKDHEHTVFKAIGLDKFNLGVNAHNEEESSKPWTPECSKS